MFFIGNTLLSARVHTTAITTIITLIITIIVLFCDNIVNRCQQYFFEENEKKNVLPKTKIVSCPDRM